MEFADHKQMVFENFEIAMIHSTSRVRVSKLDSANSFYQLIRARKKCEDKITTGYGEGFGCETDQLS